MFRYLALLVLCAISPVAFAQERRELAYRPGPILNPLKGLVPYASKTNIHFPHTLEFNYVGYGELVLGYDQFDWQPIEKLLNEIAGRGHQAVLRIYLEYPAKTNVIPKFLIDDGLKVHRYLNTNTQPLPPSKVETPDYEDKNLRRSLKNFIAAFGKKYDADPRVGFITAGLLGTWGEWHTYPREELFASKEVQAEVMDAYSEAFKTTPILLRYPAGEKTWGKAANANRPFGYHDDSFAWATLDTGKKSDDWFFLPALKEAGPSAMSKWKTHPIGGEIRPEAWGKVFDAKPGDKQIQDFRECVDQTHASWLMDTGMFKEKANAERLKRAESEVQRMGYDFYASSIQATKDGDKFNVELTIENRGVAPFYYDWKAEYGLIADGQVVQSFPSSGSLIGLLPNENARVWKDVLDTSALKTGRYTLAIRVPNTLPNGLPIRFANEEQDRDLDGWLSLLTIER